MSIGEREYHTWGTLPELSLEEFEWFGHSVCYAPFSPKEGDTNFKN